jgi:hypothetical protein
VDREEVPGLRAFPGTGNGGGGEDVIQCATCINHDLMYSGPPDTQENVNRVTAAIQKYARIYECPSYFAAHQYRGPAA